MIKKTHPQSRKSKKSQNTFYSKMVHNYSMYIHLEKKIRKRIFLEEDNYFLFDDEESTLSSSLI